MTRWNDIEWVAAASPPPSRFPAALKLLGGTVWILVAALVPIRYWPAHLISIAALALISARTHFRLRRFAARLAVLLPFIALISTAYLLQPDFGHRLINLLLKSTVSLWIAHWVISTTPLPEFLAALQQLRIPAIFVQLIGFLFRYAGVFQDEWKRMQLAEQARSFRKDSRHRQLRRRSQLLALLFLRAFERAERIHLAMLARGYSSKAKFPSIQTSGDSSS